MPPRSEQERSPNRRAWVEEVVGVVQRQPALREQDDRVNLLRSREAGNADGSFCSTLTTFDPNVTATHR